MAHRTRWSRSHSTGSCQGAVQAPPPPTSPPPPSPPLWSSSPVGCSSALWAPVFLCAATRQKRVRVSCFFFFFFLGGPKKKELRTLLPSPAHSELILINMVIGDRKIELISRRREIRFSPFYLILGFFLRLMCSLGEEKAPCASESRRLI